MYDSGDIPELSFRTIDAIGPLDGSVPDIVRWKMRAPLPPFHVPLQGLLEVHATPRYVPCFFVQLRVTLSAPACAGTLKYFAWPVPSDAQIVDGRVGALRPFVSE